MSGCQADYMYECGGVYGELAKEVQKCDNGCAFGGCTRDKCRTEQDQGQSQDQGQWQGQGQGQGQWNYQSKYIFP